MKKFILLTAPFLIFSCSISEMEEVDKLNEQIENLEITVENPIDTTNSLTSKDTDNDGIHDLADADIDGDGVIDNGSDDDADGINNLSDADLDNDGINDNGTDIDHDGINDEYDDDIDGDGIHNDDDEYQNLPDTSLSASVQQNITTYINSNYTGKTITEVEIYNQSIEIELTGDIELLFDLNGNFLSFENDNDDDDDNDDDNDNDDDDDDDDDNDDDDNDDNDNDDDDDDDDDDENDDDNEYNSLTSSNLSDAVQQKIMDYIRSNYPDLTVVEVEIESQKIEIELSNNIELIFDLNGNFLRLDD